MARLPVRMFPTFLTFLTRLSSLFSLVSHLFVLRLLPGCRRRHQTLGDLAPGRWRLPKPEGVSVPFHRSARLLQDLAQQTQPRRSRRRDPLQLCGLSLFLEAFSDRLLLFFRRCFLTDLRRAGEGDNPGFHKWSKVFIPYCSGDAWMGQQVGFFLLFLLKYTKKGAVSAFFD